MKYFETNTESGDSDICIQYVGAHSCCYGLNWFQNQTTSKQVLKMHNGMKLHVFLP